MTGHSCCIPGCDNNTRYKFNLSVHNFPKKKFFFDLWIKNIRDAGIKKDFPHLAYNKICGEHFVGGRKSSKHSIPTIFPPQSSANENEVGMESEDRETECDEADEAPQDAHSSPVTVLNAMETNISESSVSLSEPSVSFEISSSNTNQIHECQEENIEVRDSNNVASELEVVRSKATDLQKTIELAKVENTDLKKCINELTKSNHLLKLEVDRMQESLDQRKTVFAKFEDFINDDKKLRYYTGFTSRERFFKLFNFLKSDFPYLKYWDESEQPIHKTALSMETQLLIILMRLRLNLDEKDLAFRFGVSESTISSYWNTWINFLEIRLRQVPIWASPEICDKFRPEIFKEKGYSTVDGILNCTEIFIETPSPYRFQNETVYKHHNTTKGLVVCAPNGFVTFISDLAPGRLSDKVITLESGILDKFVPGRSLMADRGFMIEDQCAARNLKLNIPPFMEGREQPSLDDEKETRKIASLRIHVERVINRLKLFRILSAVFPNSMHTQLNSIWHVCCRLVNWIDNPLIQLPAS